MLNIIVVSKHLRAPRKLAFNDPRVALQPVIWGALAVAFGSATQDIALDAYRIESASSERQAALAAAYQTGYRLAMSWLKADCAPTVWMRCSNRTAT